MMTLAIGIGCRRGTSADAIENAVRAALGPLSFSDIALIASVEAKKNEAGLLAFCVRHRLTLQFFSAEEIAQTSSSFSPYAREHMNVDGVCEPCALLTSRGGPLIVSKTIVGGVTVAIARTPSKKTA
ncbi:Cobalamin biosynthesis protein CbiG [Candidatus Burkholderia humilis]|nr:Cobalamin biosynthesis protein CbiG [Candidatus Burkholderia humilis]